MSLIHQDEAHGIAVATTYRDRVVSPELLMEEQARMSLITAPASPPPIALMCWKQQIDPTKPAMLYHCTYPVGHEGPHQWEPKP